MSCLFPYSFLFLLFVLHQVRLVAWLGLLFVLILYILSDNWHMRGFLLFKSTVNAFSFLVDVFMPQIFKFRTLEISLLFHFLNLKLCHVMSLFNFFVIVLWGVFLLIMFLDNFKPLIIFLFRVLFVWISSLMSLGRLNFSHLSLFILMMIIFRIEYIATSVSL